MKSSTLILTVLPMAFMVILSGVPVASVYCEGEYASTSIIIRGYNLCEYSSLGFFPLVMPFMIYLLERTSKAAAERNNFIITATVICTYGLGYSLKIAWDHLVEIGSFPVEAHVGILLYPLGVMLLPLIAHRACRKSRPAT